MIVAKGLAHLGEILLPPAIGLGVQIDELLPLIPEESGHLGRKEGCRRLGCDPVAVRPPGASQLGGGGFSREERRTQGEEGKSASQGLEHLGTGRRGPLKLRRAPKTTRRPQPGSGRRDPLRTRSATARVHALGQPESDPSPVPHAAEREVVSSRLLRRFRLSERVPFVADASGEAVAPEPRPAGEQTITECECRTVPRRNPGERPRFDVGPRTGARLTLFRPALLRETRKSIFNEERLADRWLESCMYAGQRPTQTGGGGL